MMSGAATRAAKAKASLGSLLSSLCRPQYSGMGPSQLEHLSPKGRLERGDLLALQL